MAIGDYLDGEGRTALVDAHRWPTGGEAGLPAWRELRVHLIKHGAFYHPARVTTISDTRRFSLVLNVAVSPAGRERLMAEAAHLMRLATDYPESYLVRVYGWGHGRLAGREPLPMFLGEWLEGFHELHPTAGTDQRRPWAVWDPERGRWHLSQRQVADLFRQAVFILTYYFDPHSLEAIQGWHHAAGDFVGRAHGDGLAVRLVTVRRYAPLVQIDDEDPLTLARLLEVLTLFFLRTSLWMRLDRLDGVGDLVWADRAVLPPMWQGFVQGLDRMARRNRFPEQFIPGVLAYLAGHGRDDWTALGEAIIARFPDGVPEVALLRRHLAEHVDGLMGVVAGRAA
jgi:hypothetical protein